MGHDTHASMTESAATAAKTDNDDSGHVVWLQREARLGRRCSRPGPGRPTTTASPASPSSPRRSRWCRPARTTWCTCGTPPGRSACSAHSTCRSVGRLAGAASVCMRISRSGLLLSHMCLLLTTTLLLIVAAAGAGHAGERVALPGDRGRGEPEGPRHAGGEGATTSPRACSLTAQMMIAVVPERRSEARR